MKFKATLLNSLALACFSTSILAQAEEPAFKSFGGNEQIEVTWKNNTDRSIYINWIDFEGNIPRPSHEIKAGAEFKGISYAGHGFIVGAREATVPTILIPSGQARRTIEVQPTYPDNVISDDAFSYENDFQTGRYRAGYRTRYDSGGCRMWTHSWTFKSNGKRGVNYLTEVARSEKTIELQDPKNGTKVVLKRLDQGGGMAEVTRNGGATVSIDGRLFRMTF